MAGSNGNYELKKTTFIEFSFICHNKLKFAEGRKCFFLNLKYSFCRPLDSAAWGNRTTPPPSYAA
jgi:hypothetical protein